MTRIELIDRLDELKSLYSENRKMIEQTLYELEFGKLHLEKYNQLQNQYIYGLHQKKQIRMEQKQIEQTLQGTQVTKSVFEGLEDIFNQSLDY